jgi:hypothetical protein
VTLLPRSLHRDLRRDTSRKVEGTLGHEGGEGVDDDGGELRGIRRASVSAGTGFDRGSIDR